MELLFASRLREVRREKGLSQVDLGAMLGYGYTAISNYETGRNEPSLTDFVRLCAALEVSADYILGISNVAQPCLLLEKKEVLLLYRQAAAIASACRRYL